MLRLQQLVLLLAFFGFVGPLQAEGPRVLFIIGEQEYNTRATLPEFADRELAPRGYDCRFVHAVTDDRSRTECHDFPGLVKELGEADALVLSTRRRFLEPEALDALKQWIAGGGSVVAVRTASHGFAARDPQDVPKGRAVWPGFDREVLGATYRNHHNNKKEAGKPPTLLWVAEGAAGSAMLVGVAWRGERTTTSHLYKMRDLAESATVLLRGRVSGGEEVEPVAWAYERSPGRTFFTSLGSEEDLGDPAVRRLLVNGLAWVVAGRQ